MPPKKTKVVNEEEQKVIATQEREGDASPNSKRKTRATLPKSGEKGTKQSNDESMSDNEPPKKVKKTNDGKPVQRA